MELTLVVLMSFLPMAGVTGSSNVTGSHEPVKVFVGDDAILPCYLKPPFNVMNLTVEWSRSKTKVHVYRGRKDDPSVQDKHFKGRTFLFHDMRDGNISLNLTNVNENDAGNYSCFVPKLQSQVKRGNVTLIVEPVKDSKNNTTADPSGERNIGATQKPTTSEQPAGQNVCISAGVVISVLLLIIISILAAKYLCCNKENCRCPRGGQGRGNGQNAEDGREMVPLNV